MSLTVFSLVRARSESESDVFNLVKEKAESHANKCALFALAVLFATLLGVSWQRWTQPIIDHGREMNLPARLLAGEELYADVQFLYGPFAPHFNALLFRIFGVHLTVLHASGAVCAVLILLMIYWLAGQLMSVWEAALTAAIVLVFCALKSTGNYLQPYAYAALYGLVFSLAGLVCTVCHAQGRGRRWLWGAGLGAGLALISKPEISAAPLAAAGAALLLGSLSARRVLWREALRFAAPVIAVGVVAYGFVLIRVPWRVLIEDNHILFSNMPSQLIYFNRQISGLAEWPQSFWRTAAGLGAFALCAGLIALLGAFVSRHHEFAWRRLAWRALGLTAFGLIWWKGLADLSKLHGEVTLLTAAPLVLPLMIGVLGRRACQSWRNGKPFSQTQGLLLIIAAFSWFSISRVFLNVTTTGPYAPFFLPAVLVLYSYILLRVLPLYFAPHGLLRANLHRVAMAVLALLVIGMAINSGYRFRSRNTYEISAPRGSLITEAPLGQPLAAAMRFVEQRTAPDEAVLTLPQATSINFLAERRQPLYEEIVLPGFLPPGKEMQVIRDLETRRVPLILVANLLTPEFHDRVFGSDYNQNLMNWISQHYHLAARFDSDYSKGARFGDKPFFILAYECNPPAEVSLSNKKREVFCSSTPQQLKTSSEFLSSFVTSYASAFAQEIP